MTQLISLNQEVATLLQETPALDLFSKTLDYEKGQKAVQVTFDVTVRNGLAEQDAEVISVVFWDNTSGESESYEVTEYDSDKFIQDFYEATAEVAQSVQEYDGYRNDYERYGVHQWDFA